MRGRVQAGTATSSVTEAVKIFSLLLTNQSTSSDEALWTVYISLNYSTRCLGEASAFSEELKFNELALHS